MVSLNLNNCCLLPGSKPEPAAAEEELLMPEPMLEVFFRRVRKQLRDVQKVTTAPLTITEFNSVVEKCQTALTQEHNGVLRSYVRSQTLMNPGNDEKTS